MSKKRFLVTGGAGFIGSHIVEALVNGGAYVRVLDNFSSGKLENLSFARSLGSQTFELIRGDIRSAGTCLKSTKGIDFVLHQAALRSVPKSFLDPKEYNEVNIQGTLNLLNYAEQNKIKMFVFASSSSVYGDVKSFPEKEDFLPGPISPYALTKVAGEYYCRVFSKNYGLRTVALRYFNVFGPKQSLDDEYAVVIPKFITCLLNTKQPPIYGTGKQSRDFTYISNVVEANIRAAQSKNINCEVFNIGSGRDYSVLSLAQILNSILQKNILPVFLPKRRGDVFRTKADISRAKRLLGYSPETNFIDGLKLTVEYFKKNA